MTAKNCLDKKEIEYLSLLLGLIDSQDWKTFQFTILRNLSGFKSFAKTISRSSELNGMTFLHACVRFDPPAHIVQMIINLCPDSPSTMDCLRRTPLHIAAGTRANISTLKILADAYPMACDIQDEDGKTPLHFACDSSCELFEDDENISRKPPSYDVIKLLLSASPLSVTIEDDTEMSPLEHALLSDSPITVINMLQKETQKQFRRQHRTAISMKKTSVLREVGHA